jgi:hypothetical protein
MSNSEKGCTRRAFMVVGGVVVGAATMTAAAHAGPHPKIESAITALEEAREYLEKARHDFHGHRKDAVRKVREAIEELRICLKS